MSLDWLPAWQEAAGVLGLSLDAHPDAGAHLYGSVDGVDVRCAIGFMPGAPAYLDGTSADAAPPALPPKLRLSVARGYVYPLGRPFIQDIRTGDAIFDERFIVKGSNEELVRLWLSPAVREHIGSAEDWRFKLRAGHAHASLDKVESSGTILVSALRGLVGLARRGLDLQGELAALAGGLGGQREPAAWDGGAAHPIFLDAEGTRFAIWHRHGRFGNRRRAPEALYTRVACQRAEGATRRFLLARRTLATGFGGPGRSTPIPDEGLHEKYVARADDADHLLAHLTPTVRTLVARILPDAVVVDDEVSVWSLGLQLTRAAVAPLVELAAALAPEPLAVGSGPYR